MLRLTLELVLGMMLGIMLGFRSIKTLRVPLNKRFLSFGC